MRVAVGIVAVATGCSDATAPELGPVAFDVALVSGDGQTGPTGAPLGEGLLVKATDVDGGALERVTIRWSVETGGGRFATGGRSDASLTDEQGISGVSFTPMLPGRTTVLAVADRSPAAPVRFTIDAVPLDWLPTFEGATVTYDRYGEEATGGHNRYVLQSADAGGRFSFQYMSCCFSGEFQGTYAREGDRIDFAFDADEDWLATGTLRGDSMYVVHSIEAALSGFEDGLYIRSR